MNKKKRLLLISIPLAVIVLGVLFAVWRPDVRLALSVIDHAWEHPEDDPRVELAAQYLIWTEHPMTYEKLRHYLLSCRGDVDYSAERAATILGEYEDPRSMEALMKIFAFDYSKEGVPYCERYVFVGLKLKGEEGFAAILDVAKGEVCLWFRFRAWAIGILADTGDPKYQDDLIDVALHASYWGLRRSAAYSLVELGTPEAIEVVRQIAETDENVYVRETAAEALASIEE